MPFTLCSENNTKLTQKRTQQRQSNAKNRTTQSNTIHEPFSTGIDVANKQIEGHLCSFVDEAGRMHKDFMKHLRDDGMGVDYTDIHYRFKDPRPNAPQD